MRQPSRFVRVGLLAALLLSLFAWPFISKAEEYTYVPETGHYVGGVFRDYWNTYGGLDVFGYPITEEYIAANGRLTQWFERTRFELFPENAGTRYHVQLGLLGKEATLGRVFPQVPPRQNDANHRYFPETSHVLMWGFKTIWESKGGLETFGYPISEEMMEILPADGQWHIVQYFERARYEYWPNLPDGKRVLVSDLGRRLAPRELLPPVPPGSPPGTQPPPPAPAPPTGPELPPNIDASVDPRSGPVGTIFRFNAWGFQPGESISLWATAPDQQVLPADFQITADGDGSIASSEITFNAAEGIPTGMWAVTFQGTATGHASVAFFEVTGNAPPPPPPPPPPSNQLPDDYNARVEPREAPAGSTFRVYANGFAPNEQVASAIFDEYGNMVSNIVGLYADGNGSIDYAGLQFQTSENVTPGVYEAYLVSESDREAYAYFRITSPNSTQLFSTTRPQMSLSQAILTGSAIHETNIDIFTSYSR